MHRDKLQEKLEAGPMQRQFIAGLGSTAAWPVVARVQQGGQMRRIGILTAYTESDRNGQANVAALVRGLRDLGWTDGRDLRIAYYWGSDSIDSIRAPTAKLVATGSAAWHPPQQASAAARSLGEESTPFAEQSPHNGHGDSHTTPEYVS
jgi:hypothetical protein